MYAQRQEQGQEMYPLPISRGLGAARNAVAEGVGQHDAVMRLADAITCYLGAVAVGQYSQALYTGKIEHDPTLARSLRSLKRVLPGQWLLWAARGLEATPNGPVERLSGWYLDKQRGEIAQVYGALQRVMASELGYTGEYGARSEVSPRALLEMVDQYRIIRGKRLAGQASFEHDDEVASALLSGLATLVASSDFFIEYDLYAPGQRQLLMGAKATMPMPPMTAPADATASLLLYPPGEAPDYTKRPNLQNERAPLFPLDPLLVYGQCDECGSYRVGALRGVVDGVPSYIGLDPECWHELLLMGPGEATTTEDRV